MNQNTKTYILTGGAVFICSHLVEHLMNGKNNVLIIDDLSSGYENNVSNRLNNSFLKKQVQEVADQDIDSVHGIFHLAAQSSVPYSVDNFFESSKNNILSLVFQAFFQTFFTSGCGKKLKSSQRIFAVRIDFF